MKRGVMLTGFSSLRIGSRGGLLWTRYESSDPIKGGNFSTGWVTINYSEKYCTMDVVRIAWWVFILFVSFIMTRHKDMRWMLRIVTRRWEISCRVKLMSVVISGKWQGVEVMVFEKRPHFLSKSWRIPFAVRHSIVHSSAGEGRLTRLN